MVGGIAARREVWQENARRAAECAAVGLLITVFSLPIVTAGSAWLAAATVFDAWTRHEEPRLLATFWRTLRSHWRTGLAVEGAMLAVALVAYFDIRFAMAVEVPGAAIEVAALAVLCGATAAYVMLTVAVWARTHKGWREARALALRAPWTIAALGLACAAAVTLVAIVPAFVLIIGGPLWFAASAVYAKATA